MKKLLFFFGLIVVSMNVSAQDSIQKQQKEKKPLRLPIISVGQGLFNFLGDVGFNGYNQPIVSRSGFQIELQPQTKHRLAYSLFFLSGHMLGDEKTSTRALNFKTSLMSGGLMFRFDFISGKRDNQVIIPFITAGAEYMQFNTNSDLKDNSGTDYQYWSDGSIRNIAESDPNSDQAKVIYRDYYYETDLRKANLDSFGEYKNTTWGIPVGIGARLKFSERVSLHLSSVYHITGTDFIDGITADGKGTRQGNSKNDNFLFSSISIRFALSNPNNDYSNVDFNALANEDADGDGITDLLDDSSGTPLNNAVDANGKPFDNDNDGIPDYRDKEPSSSIDAVVNEDGITITEAMIEEKFRKDSLAALPAIVEYLKSYDKLTQRNPEVEKRWLEKNQLTNRNPDKDPIPPVYGKLDTDFNGILTPKEMSIAIDDYLAKKSNYTVAEFFDLIDFFFSQK